MTDAVNAGANEPIGAPVGEAEGLMARYRAGQDLAQEEFGSLSGAIADDTVATTLSVTDDEKQDIQTKAGDAVFLTETDFT